MSEHKNHHGKMKSAEDAVAEIATKKRSQRVIVEWYRLQRKHEFAALKETQSAENYKKRIRLVEEKFANK